MQKIIDYLIFKNLFGRNYLYYLFIILLVLLVIDLCIGSFSSYSVFFFKSSLLINCFAFIGAVIILRLFIERYMVTFMFINKLQELLVDENVDIYAYRKGGFFSFDSLYIAWIILFLFFVFSSYFVFHGVFSSYIDYDSWPYLFFIKQGISLPVSMFMSVVLQILHLRVLCELLLAKTIFKLSIYLKMQIFIE